MKYHRPTPPRIITHHILPKVAGGKSTADNQVWICDNHHYLVHGLMFGLAQGHGLPEHVSPAARALALSGYTRARLAGTVHLIPNEG